MPLCVAVMRRAIVNCVRVVRLASEQMEEDVGNHLTTITKALKFFEKTQQEKRCQVSLRGAKWNCASCGATIVPLGHCVVRSGIAPRVAQR